MRAPPPLRLEPRRSRVLAAWIYGLHGAALAACWLLRPPGWLGGLGSALLLAHLGYAHALHLTRRLPWSVRALYWDDRRGWRLERADGRLLQVRMQAPPFVTPGLVALRLKAGGWRRYGLPLFADALDAANARRLRRLLLRPGPPPH